MILHGGFALDLHAAPTHAVNEAEVRPQRTPQEPDGAHLQRIAVQQVHMRRQATAQVGDKVIDRQHGLVEFVVARDIDDGHGDAVQQPHEPLLRHLGLVGDVTRQHDEVFALRLVAPVGHLQMQIREDP